MAYRRFRTGLVLRMAGMTLLLAGSIVLFCLTDWIITPALLLGAALLAIVATVFYAEKPERNFYAFLQAIRYRDFTYLQTIRNRGTHRRYQELFTEVMEEFRLLKANREAYRESIELVLQQLEAGVICYETESGRIMIINPAALRFLGRPYLTHFHTLQHSAPELYGQLMAPSGHILRQVVDGRAMAIALHNREFRLQQVPMRLLVLQNIRGELDTQELESWQKLISVLTHEMMNSITPVISLADIIAGALTEDTLGRIQRGEMGAEELEELRLSASIIRNRSENLLRFVHTYRQITKVPQPQKSETDLAEICRHAQHLFRVQMQQEGIRFQLVLPAGPVLVMADAALAEQVLINLVKNALEAVRLMERREVTIELHSSAPPRIVVSDTGPGIEADVLEQIFVPFFTTKAQGSGIGLSLSRQIMRLHGGNIYVKSTPGQGSEFILEF